MSDSKFSIIHTCFILFNGHLQYDSFLVRGALAKVQQALGSLLTHLSLPHLHSGQGVGSRAGQQERGTGLETPGRGTGETSQMRETNTMHCVNLLALCKQYTVRVSKSLERTSRRCRIRRKWQKLRKCIICTCDILRRTAECCASESGKVGECQKPKLRFQNKITFDSY